PSSFRPHFFFHAHSPTAIYTLSLHDALPIFLPARLYLYSARYSLSYLLAHSSAVNMAWALFASCSHAAPNAHSFCLPKPLRLSLDRKSTRLNSSHLVISYAVFCLKKKILITC